jgi:hypothetical protein
MKASKVTTWTIKDKILIPRNRGYSENKNIHLTQDLCMNKLWTYKTFKNDNDSTGKPHKND